MVKHKKANCDECGNLKFIYAKKLCSWCYEKQRKKTPLPKPKKQIAKFSKSSLSHLKRYRTLRDKFLSENPICMYPGCDSREVTLHHARGRIGAFLTDKGNFKSLCWPHHQHIEQNPALAKKLGLSYSRLKTEP